MCKKLQTKRGLVWLKQNTVFVGGRTNKERRGRDRNKGTQNLFDLGAFVLPFRKIRDTNRVQNMLANRWLINHARVGKIKTEMKLWSGKDLNAPNRIKTNVVCH